MAISVYKAPYAGWPNCFWVVNEKVECVVTSDVGPRVIRFALKGGPNEFAEMQEQLGLTGGDEWRIYGGHRLWHSPEKRARTYFPDNAPVQVTVLPDGVEVTQPTETTTGIKKVIRLRMAPEAPRVEVEHRLINEGLWRVEMAAWCLSVMAPGGVGIVPQDLTADEEGLLPNRVLSLWPYTDLSDPRYTWGKHLIRLRQDPQRGPTKFGLSVPAGWCAYANRGHMFIKQFSYLEDRTYPDFGASVELYTNERFLELETLSPLYVVAPGEEIAHLETWHLFAGVELPTDEEEVMTAVARLLGRA